MRGSFKKKTSIASESFDLCDLLMNAASNHYFLENGQNDPSSVNVITYHHYCAYVCVHMSDSLITIPEWNSCLERSCGWGWWGCRGRDKVEYRASYFIYLFIFCIAGERKEILKLKGND